MVTPIDLSLVHAFVAVAEEEHVGRASERLHVSSSPLSRQIRKLEDDLGVQLFQRVRQRIRLTAEGRRFLEEARALLAHADSVRDRMRAGGGMLSIGCSQNALLDGSVMAALKAFRVASPQVTIRISRLRSGPQVDRLRRGALDIGFLNTAPTDADFVCRLIGDDPFVLALPAAHPLATEPRIEPHQLDGQPWFALDRAVNPTFDAVFRRACADYGFRPDIRFEGNDLMTGLALIDAGLGMCLMQSALARWPLPQGVVLRDLPGFPLSVKTFAVWRRGALVPTLDRFLSVLDAEVAARVNAATGPSRVDAVPAAC